MTSKPSEEIQDLFPRAVLGIEKALRQPSLLRVVHDSGFRIHPFTAQIAAEVARSNAHSRIISNTFYFSGVSRRIDIKNAIGAVRSNRAGLGKPHRRADALSVFTKRFQIEIFLTGK